MLCRRFTEVRHAVVGRIGPKRVSRRQVAETLNVDESTIRKYDGADKSAPGAKNANENNGAKNASAANPHRRFRARAGR